MNTMGWSFLVGFTQLVSTSRIAARSTPDQLNRPARPPAPSWNWLRIPVSGAVTTMLVSTSNTTDAQAAPIRPVEAGRRP